MYVLNITDDKITFSNCTIKENKDNSNIFTFLLLSIPKNILLLSLRSLRIYTLIKPLITIKRKGKNFYTKILQFVVL